MDIQINERNFYEVTVLHQLEEIITFLSKKLPSTIEILVDFWSTTWLDQVYVCRGFKHAREFGLNPVCGSGIWNWQINFLISKLVLSLSY